jgi:hypothetical protein
MVIPHLWVLLLLGEIASPSFSVSSSGRVVSMAVLSVWRNKME